jgi:tetratricopeptide (TPR) repeat protein
VELVTKTSDYLIFSLRADNSSRAAPLGQAMILDSKVPLDARKEFERGRTALLGNSKPEEGIAHLEKAVGMYPGFLEAYLMLGTAYLDTRRLDKAESTLRKAVEINARRPEAYFALGEVYRQQKKYAEGEKELLAGLKIEDSWRGHIALGRLYWDQGDVAKAGKRVGRALQLKPDLAEGHLLAGNILLKAHQAENALAEFQEYLRLEPKGKFAAEAQEMVQRIKKALDEKKN